MVDTISRKPAIFGLAMFGTTRFNAIPPPDDPDVEFLGDPHAARTRAISDPPASASPALWVEEL